MPALKAKLITVIPVYNGAQFLAQTLQSVAAQTLKPDRVILLDNSSTDNTEDVVKGFKGLRCEWRPNEKNIGPLANFNRVLEFSDQTEYLHLLCADDMIKPGFYTRLTRELDSCKGLGMAYCLDERIDENNERLSVSGKETGAVEIQAIEDYLREKAEIGNQAISASLLRTAGQRLPCQFRPEYVMLADSFFWGELGSHCERVVRVHEALAQYRWHQANGTSDYAPQIDSLVVDEWRVMQRLEQLRGAAPSFIRQFKLRGLFAVRAGIKSKRFRQNRNFDYARQIVQVARGICGPLPWYMGQAVVEARELLVFKLGKRRQHPKNIHG